MVEEPADARCPTEAGGSVVEACRCHADHARQTAGRLDGDRRLSNIPQRAAGEIFSGPGKKIADFSANQSEWPRLWM